MKRILIDLDVLTNAFWKGQSKALAVNFIDKELSNRIINFYKLYSREIITVEKLSERLREKKADYPKLSEELTKITNKDDDSDLVLIAGLFELDYLVTFNRKHLSNKKEQILQFLAAKNLKPIEVVLPNEI